MSLYVLDASAVLAYLWRETGWERVEQVLLSESSLISVVNVTEVACKALERGIPEAKARPMIDNLGMNQHDFDREMAWTTARLRSSKRAWGLSLGDRACLSLAQSRECVALTADKSWLELDIGIQIECIR